MNALSARRLLLASAAALTLGAAVASAAAYATWRTAPHPVGAQEVQTVAAELVPGGIVAAVADGLSTGGGFPTWMWFDEPTDGGYTGVTVEPPPGYPGVAQLGEDMRRAGWSTGPADSGIEGLKAGIYVDTSLDDGSLQLTLVRDSWPGLKLAVVLGWLAGAAAGVALAVRMARSGAGRALAVVLAALAAPTLLATSLLGHYLSPARSGFGLDVWGAYTIVFFTPFVALSLILPVVVLVASGRSRELTPSS